MVILIVILFVLSLWFIRNSLSKKFVVNLFDRGNVCVTGMRGRGKDVLFNYVIRRRAKPYISNVDYGGLKVDDFRPKEQFGIGGNTAENFIEDNLIPYDYPYDDGIDYYVSDAGVYFPSQEFGLLNKKYRSMPIFQALSRHLGDCNVHFNAQNLNRVWDKIREQSDTYVLCRDCTWIFKKIVIMNVTVYDRMESCINRVRSFGKRPMLNRQKQLAYDSLVATHGNIRDFKMVFIHKGNYDTRRFKSLLASNKHIEECLNEKK